jgi:hypothetical protein
MTRWAGLRDLLAKPDANAVILFLVIQALCIAGALIFPDQFRYLSRREHRPHA